MLMFGSRLEEGTGGWVYLRSEKLRGSYSSQDIVMAMKLWRTGWAAHVAQVGKTR
jgi:hypothetical protein